MENRIEIKNLNFSFDKNTQIINDVSISIAKGAFLSILGASGSGKSTLLRIISNILPSGKNNILEGTISIFEKNPKEYLDTGKLSFMFQEASLMPNLSVRENITFPLKLRGKEINTNFIDDLLKIVGLESHQHKYPSELSGGMKTRTSLARAFVTKPELLLLDEPFSALDVSWRYDLYGYLEKFTSKFNTTVLLVTHDIQEAIILGDNIIVLSQKGKVLRNISPIKGEQSSYDFETVNKCIESNLDNFLSLQTEILIDGIRSSASLGDALDTLAFLKEKIKNEQESNKYVLAKIHTVQEYANITEIHSSLIKLWNLSKNWNFKQELMWRILDNPEATKKIHQNIADFIHSDWNKFVKESQSQEYFKKSEIVTRTIERLKNQEYPSTKDWLYLTYLKAMSVGSSVDEQKAIQFIKEYIENNKENKFINILLESKK